MLLSRAQYPVIEKLVQRTFRAAFVGREYPGHLLEVDVLVSAGNAHMLSDLCFTHGKLSRTQVIKYPIQPINYVMIGVISDTHDNMEAMDKAVRFFNNKKVEFVVFAGDFVTPLSVEPLKNLECPLKGIFGNNEGDKVNVNRKLSEVGAEFSDFLEMEHDDRKIAVYHGHNPNILDALVKSGKYDIVIAGHTHTPETTVEGKTMLLNPGECCGYLTGIRTIATLDLKEMKAEIHEL